MVCWTLRGFVWASWVVRWQGMNEVGWWLMQVVWCVSPAHITLRQTQIFKYWPVKVDTYVWRWRNVTWTRYAVAIQGGSLGFFGWWSDVCNLKNDCLLWVITVFWSGFFHLLFLRVDCECNRPSFLATVFYEASAFNGELNNWNVANVTKMYRSKSIHTYIENDLAWRELMLLWLKGSVGGLCWRWWCDVKMVEIEGTPTAHFYIVCGLWLTVIFLWDFLMNFPYDVSLFLAVTRFSFEILCFLASWDFMHFLVGLMLFWPLWYFFMKFHVFFCIDFLWDFLMRFHVFCRC